MISAQLDKNVPIKSIISELLDTIIARDCAGKKYKSIQFQKKQI